MASSSSSSSSSSSTSSSSWWWSRHKKKKNEENPRAAATTTSDDDNVVIKPLSLPANPMLLRNPGWLERVVEGTFYCGCAGVASGLAFALVRGRPVSVAPHYALNMATNFVVVGGTFLGSKETAKLLRQRDGVANDVIAGGVTGSAIWSLYQGASGAPSGFLLGSIVAGMGSAFLSDELGKVFDAFELPGWFPVRKITEEEEKEIEEEKLLHSRMRQVMMGEFDENEAARLRNELLVRRQVKRERERDRMAK
jgi:hypothetical protein